MKSRYFRVNPIDKKKDVGWDSICPARFDGIVLLLKDRLRGTECSQGGHAGDPKGFARRQHRICGADLSTTKPLFHAMKSAQKILSTLKRILGCGPALVAVPVQLELNLPRPRRRAL